MSGKGTRFIRALLVALLATASAWLLFREPAGMARPSHDSGPTPRPSDGVAADTRDPGSAGRVLVADDARRQPSAAHRMRIVESGSGRPATGLRLRGSGEIPDAVVGHDGAVDLRVGSRYAFDSPVYGRGRLVLTAGHEPDVVRVRRVRRCLLRCSSPDPAPIPMALEAIDEGVSPVLLQPTDASFLFEPGVEVPVTLPEGRWIVEADGGVVVSPFSFEVVEGAVIDLTVVSGARLAGTVVDQAGLPCEGVDVRAVGGRAVSDVTDERGTFVLTPVDAPAFLHVGERTGGVAALHGEGPFRPGDDVRLVVIRAREWVWECLLDGAPLDGAVVRLQSSLDDIELVPRADGAFALPRALGGRDVIRVAVGDVSFRVTDWSTSTSSEVVRYRTDVHSRSVRVRVLDQRGRPIAGAMVEWVQGLRDEQLALHAGRLLAAGVSLPGALSSGVVRTDAMGATSLPRAIGRGLVIASRDGFGRAATWLDATRSEVEFTLPRTSSFAGTILLPSGASWDPPRVRALDTAHGVVEMEVAADGSFELPALTEGEHTAQVLLGPIGQQATVALPPFRVPAEGGYVADLRHLRFVEVVLSEPPAGSRALRDTDEVRLVPIDERQGFVPLRVVDGRRRAIVPFGRYWLVARGISMRTGSRTECASALTLSGAVARVVVPFGLDESSTFLAVRLDGAPARDAWLRVPGGQVLACSAEGRAVHVGHLPPGYPVQAVRFVDGAWQSVGEPLLLVDEDTGAPDQALRVR